MKHPLFSFPVMALVPYVACWNCRPSRSCRRCQAYGLLRGPEYRRLACALRTGVSVRRFIARLHDCHELFCLLREIRRLGGFSLESKDGTPRLVKAIQYDDIALVTFLVGYQSPDFPVYQ